MELSFETQWCNCEFCLSAADESSKVFHQTIGTKMFEKKTDLFEMFTSIELKYYIITLFVNTFGEKVYQCKK